MKSFGFDLFDFGKEVTWKTPNSNDIGYYF